MNYSWGEKFQICNKILTITTTLYVHPKGSYTLIWTFWQAKPPPLAITNLFSDLWAQGFFVLFVSEIPHLNEIIQLIYY